MEKGIAEYVVMTGEKLKAPDAYADVRFNTVMNIKNDLIIHDILCIPMKTREGDIIGAIQV